MSESKLTTCETANRRLVGDKSNRWRCDLFWREVVALPVKFKLVNNALPLCGRARSNGIGPPLERVGHFVLAHISSAHN